MVGAGATYLSQHALAARQARIGYQYAARKRLYEALGPLRFQLLMASRDVVRRVTGHAPPRTWNLDTAQYYGQSTMYRLLRPLAICILIERQMNAADFSVDPSGVRLLRFEVGAYRMLTNSDPLAVLLRARLGQAKPSTSSATTFGAPPAQLIQH